MPAAGFGPGPGNGKQYPGNLTLYVTITCMVAAMGGLIFGYDIGISGKIITTQNPPSLPNFSQSHVFLINSIIPILFHHHVCVCLFLQVG